MSKDKTVKRKVKVLKTGSKIRIPPQTLTVLSRTRIDMPTKNGEIYNLSVRGESGPYMGHIINMYAHADEDFDYVLKAPALQRLFMWVWRSFFWNPDFKPAIQKK